MSIEHFSDPVFDDIYDHVTANWPHTPIQWPNETWSNVPDTPWVKVEFDGRNYGQQSVGAETQGANRWDRDGEIKFYLSVPRGTGASSGFGAALAIAQLFRGRVSLNGSLEFLDAEISPSKYGDDIGAWFVIPVTVEWRQIEA